MSTVSLNTECIIKEQSKNLFFKKGHLNATTQEIADFAGVKRTLVNYYFRSKENLFATVYQELIHHMKTGLDEIYDMNIDFEKKIEIFIDFFYQFKLEYPYLEIFNIQESNNILNTSQELIQPHPSKFLNKFLEEIQTAMDKGLIKTSHPINFVINILSLISFPLIMKPIFIRVYALDDEAYNELIDERKMMIKQLLFN